MTNSSQFCVRSYDYVGTLTPEILPSDVYYVLVTSTPRKDTYDLELYTTDDYKQFLTITGDTLPQTLNDALSDSAHVMVDVPCTSINTIHQKLIQFFYKSSVVRVIPDVKMAEVTLPTLEGQTCAQAA